MFKGILAEDTKVYATTAANEKESSFGTYCDEDAVVNGTNLHTLWLCRNHDVDARNQTHRLMSTQVPRRPLLGLLARGRGQRLPA